MAETMARDRIGRIIYEGDKVFDHRGDESTVLYVGMYHIETDAVEFIASYENCCIYTVNIEASPPRTNWERYFADIGTIDEIGDITTPHKKGSICNAYNIVCEGCPLNDWKGNCIAFMAWLRETAVI